ncbi:nitronate monooxygenase [uncultured Parasphingorhabdus sp.]|uniref:NAD(P)H-dependent flavin oxidoreductase n=1 Tax=uncultured Parasphingorhabdus sp. TaxID=2709694 RepID=UPI0030DA8AB4|tara:strand:- start:20966 stop:22012 length:1047 start_codon:yes stop_codon:yes gene_type:complete
MQKPLITNRFVERFNLSTPIALAPMALANGGNLAAACARAGALSLVGGGYGDLVWTQREYSEAISLLDGNQDNLSRLGCGFISWKLAEDRSAFDWLLDQPQKPAAVMLSFGDPTAFAKILSDLNIPVICQIQTMAQLPQALDAGASVIVAQGTEAGGHGMNEREGRNTFTFVPEIADWLAKHSPQTILLAAGGIADGRGLAAAMTLGADGALIGSRLWATTQSLATESAKNIALQASGDDTTRSSIFDILRGKNWPEQFDFRAIRNKLHRKWEGRIDELRSDPAAAMEDYASGAGQEDYDRAHITVGQDVGLINDISSAEEVIDNIGQEAARLLNGGNTGKIATRRLA